MTGYPLLISENCLSSQLNKQLKLKQTHPFHWSSMTKRDMIILSENWDLINFDNIDIRTIVDKNCRNVVVIIENEIPVYFTHHKISNDPRFYNSPNPVKQHIDLLWNEQMTGYVKQKWQFLTKTMKKVHKNKKPTFIMNLGLELKRFKNFTIFKNFKESDETIQTNRSFEEANKLFSNYVPVSKFIFEIAEYDLNRIEFKQTYKIIFETFPTKFVSSFKNGNDLEQDVVCDFLINDEKFMNIIMN